MTAYYRLYTKEKKKGKKKEGPSGSSPQRKGCLTGGGDIYSEEDELRDVRHIVYTVDCAFVEHVVRDLDVVVENGMMDDVDYTVDYVKKMGECSEEGVFHYVNKGQYGGNPAVYASTLYAFFIGVLLYDGNYGGEIAVRLEARLMTQERVVSSAYFSATLGYDFISLTKWEIAKAEDKVADFLGPAEEPRVIAGSLPEPNGAVTTLKDEFSGETVTHLQSTITEAHQPFIQPMPEYENFDQNDVTIIIRQHSGKDKSENLGFQGVSP